MGYLSLFFITIILKMFKKLIAFVSILALSASLFAMPVFAADIQTGLIKTVVLSVDNGSAQTFDPGTNPAQKLKTAVTYEPNFSQQLTISTGYARVMKGTSAVNTLVTWTNQDAAQQSVPDWDGKTIDNTAEAQAVCGTQGAICPEGDYKVEVRVEYTSGSDKIFDLKTADFKIFTLAVNNPAVSPTTFNPLLPQTADISFDLALKTGLTNAFVTVEVFDGTTLKKTLLNNVSLAGGAHSKTDQSALAWDGKDSAGVLLPNKTYTIKVSARKLQADANPVDTKTVDVVLNAPTTVTIDIFNLTFNPSKTGGTFDPSSKGDNQDLIIDYSLSQAADTVQIDIKDSKNNVIKTQSATTVSSGQFQWDGFTGNKLALPGVYTALLTVTKSGSNSVTSLKTFTVAYNNSNKGDISGFTVAPDNFDPDVEDAVIEFKNTKDSNITMEIKDSNDGVIKTFSDYDDDNYSSEITHSIAWNGQNTSGGDVSVGSYKVVVITRNEYGVVVAEKTIAVNNSGGSVSTSNAHISGISFSPSSKFEPAKNDELKITFDVEKKLDELKVYAIRGTQKIELLDETDMDEENNVEITWDGRDDDDEYVDKESWKIQFQSKVGSTSLIAAKSITVEYEKPGIDDLELSKVKFDNDLGEFTYILFRVDSEADVTITVLEDNDEQDNIVEDMEVDANKWYAVAWDGDNYNYDDDVDLKLIAQNSANNDVFDSDKISVDLAEDTVASSKSNVTMDYISPAATNGNEEMALYYNLEEEADVVVTIHKGTSSSGTKVIQLADVKDQESGDHSIIWNGMDEKGNKLSNGFYTYKIVSNTSSSETETGLFVVGSVGDVEGGGGSVSSSGGSSSPNIIVDGGDKKDDEVKDEAIKDEAIIVEEDKETEVAKTCAGFTDVSANSEHCAAIEWVKSAGIFTGYANGTFGENKAIIRVELLKVILEAYGIDVPDTVAGNLGFKDVVAGAWYMPYIKVAKEKGIFQGDAGKGIARPDGVINAAETVKLLVESIKAAGIIDEVGGSCNTGFSDVPLNAWYNKYVCKLQNLIGVQAEDNAGSTFDPGEFPTRVEIAELFYALHLVNLI